ncbi:MAG: hypothetical protein LC802_21060 [Acidobacteria bacterium]|nr:hypothetical protein [Acidobacteriota bacterium]
MKTTAKRKPVARIQDFTPAEQRSARAERVSVFEAEPYGWIARSEASGARAVARVYHLFRDPETRELACTCADSIFRGHSEPGFECKHVAAVLKFIGRQYLRDEYDPRRQQQQQRARVA